MDTSNLIITGVQPGSAVKSRLHVIVFILVFKSGHRWFTCHQCPNLNLTQLSECQSDALKIHSSTQWNSEICCCMAHMALSLSYLSSRSRTPGGRFDLIFLAPPDYTEFLDSLLPDKASLVNCTGSEIRVIKVLPRMTNKMCATEKK